MTIKQVYWAMDHDWFLWASTCSVTGDRLVMCRDDMEPSLKIQFSDYEKLRAWAGY